MEYLRLVFWCLACILLAIFVGIAGLALFWLRTDSHDYDEDDGISWDDDWDDQPTLEWNREKVRSV